MRFSLLAILFATAGLLGSSTAYAQYRNNGQARRTVTPRSTYTNSTYYQPAEASPSDAPAPPTNGNGGYAPSCACEPSCEAEPTCEAEPDCGAEPSCGCESNGCGCDCCCCDWCDLGEPWVLFDGCCLEEKGIVIKGWANGGYTYNSRDPIDRFNGPQTFNDRHNEFQMNQFYLYVEKAANTEEQCTDWGYRVDLLYGTDWRTTPAVGLEIDEDGTRRWNHSQRFYGLALPQFYGSFKLNDLEIRVGKFYTTAGYEVVTSPGNFFYSHAYTHQYFEPFTHTGVMSMYQMTDNLSVHACVNRGWDQFEDINDSPSLLAGFTWTSCDKKTSFAYAMTYGDEANELFFQNEQNRYYQGLVFQRQVNDKLKYVAHSDYGFQENVTGAGTPNAEWYSFTQYLLYTVNDCLSYGVRYEWARDDDGFRIFGFGSGAEPSIGYQGGGYAGTFQDITAGINYKPHANLLVRPEVRWDWYDGASSTNVNAAGVTLARPFNFGQDSSQFTVGCDAIFTY